jgi:hypothetical protein
MPDKNKKICGAKTHKGGICKNPPVAGRTRCKYHGGKTAPPGPTHHSFKTGRQSKFLPGKLNDTFLQAFNDPELLSLRKYAALYDVRVRQLARRLYTGESGGMWLRLGEQWEALEASQNDIREATEAVRHYREIASSTLDDKEREAAIRSMREAEERRALSTERFGVALKKIGSLIASGKKDETNWRELLSVADEASAMKFRETKRLESERMMVPITEVMTLVTTIYMHCRESAEELLPADTSKRLLLRIGDGLNTLLNSAGNHNRKLHESTVSAQDAVVIDVESDSDATLDGQDGDTCESGDDAG